jgi:hypothetical protein
MVIEYESQSFLRLGNPTYQVNMILHPEYDFINSSLANELYLDHIIIPIHLTYLLFLLSFIFEKDMRKKSVYDKVLPETF